MKEFPELGIGDLVYGLFGLNGPMPVSFLVLSNVEDLFENGVSKKVVWVYFLKGNKELVNRKLYFDLSDSFTLTIKEIVPFCP